MARLRSRAAQNSDQRPGASDAAVTSESSSGADRVQRGSKIANLYPLTPDADVRALRREQDWRMEEPADLPDPLSEEEESAMNEAWVQWQAGLGYAEHVGRPK